MSFYSTSIFWRGFLATCVGVLTLHILADAKDHPGHLLATKFGRFRDFGGPTGGDGGWGGRVRGADALPGCIACLCWQCHHCRCGPAPQHWVHSVARLVSVDLRVLSGYGQPCNGDARQSSRSGA